MGTKSDTIAALATAAGTAALAVVRVCGPKALEIAEASLGKAPRSRSTSHRDYRDISGILIDDVVAVCSPGPRTYTGEDTLEISCHGNPFIVRRILDDLHARGARPALPGEFTQRAFLNGRMDLAQAEAVMDIIRARSERSLASAQQVLRGALGRHLEGIIAALLDSLAQVEAYIDFPDEDLPQQDRRRLEERVRGALEATEKLLATERTGVLLREGISTALVGEPNAGKSSLLNRLLGTDRAIVSPEPGTTRDFLEEQAHVDGHALRLVDTAGLNALAQGIEKMGVERTIERASQADLFLWVVDATRPTPPLDPRVRSRIQSSNTLFVANKADLVPAGTPCAARAPEGLRQVEISALTGQGITELKSALGQLASSLETTVGDERIAINARHAHYLEVARASLGAACAKVVDHGPPELLASDLRGALAAIGEISGKVDNERMLDQLFASFCIGK